MLLPLLLLPVLLQSEDPVTAYRGKYAREPAFKKAFRDLDKHRRRALDSIDEKLGLRAKNPRRIDFTIEDAWPEDAVRIERYDAPALQTSDVKWSTGTRIEILIRPEFVMSGRVRLEPEVTHEMVHAVMRDLMEAETYYAVPRWVREGVALWAAGQGPDRVQQILISNRSFSRLGLAFPGLDQGKAGLHRYGEYYLAVDYIASRGSGTLKSFVSEIVRGTEVAELVKKLLDLRWNQFVGECQAHAREYAESILPADWDEFIAIEAADEARDYPESRRLAEAFLEAHVDSPMISEVLYFHGKACRLSKAPAAGRRSLERVVAEFPSTSDFVDESLYQLAAGYQEEGDHARGVPYLQRILRDIPDAAHLDTVVWRLAACLVETGKKKEARTYLDLFTRSFADSRRRPDVDALYERLTER